MTTKRLEGEKTIKIVINSCFGGFGLSDEAFEMYLNLKGIKYYKYPSELSFNGEFFTVPREKYEMLSEKWRKEDGNYKRINEKNWYLSYTDIKRDDPVIVKVVKKLKDKANATFAKLKIVNVPNGTDWEIDEDDGLETVEEKHKSWS